MHGSLGRFGHDFFTFGRHQSGGFIMMGIGLILIIILAYFLFKKGHFNGSSSLESPMDILQKRYVNGEINQEEFFEKKEVLGKRK